MTLANREYPSWSHIFVCKRRYIVRIRLHIGYIVYRYLSLGERKVILTSKNGDN